MWRGWAARFRWRERAAEYDQYLDRLKQAEKRKTIEGQEAAYRETTKKMLQMVNKKLDLMKPGELTQGAVKEWVEAAVRTEREIGQFANANCLGVSTCRNSTPSQMEINFTPEFEGL
jgi:sugar-specific transcriptional regulator TrmB